jgi:hypothetical protein
MAGGAFRAGLFGGLALKAGVSVAAILYLGKSVVRRQSHPLAAHVEASLDDRREKEGR